MGLDHCMHTASKVELNKCTSIIESCGNHANATLFLSDGDADVINTTDRVVTSWVARALVEPKESKVPAKLLIPRYTPVTIKGGAEVAMYSDTLYLVVSHQEL